MSLSSKKAAAGVQWRTLGDDKEEKRSEVKQRCVVALRDISCGEIVCISAPYTYFWEQQRSRSREIPLDYWSRRVSWRQEIPIFLFCATADCAEPPHVTWCDLPDYDRWWSSATNNKSAWLSRELFLDNVIGHGWFWDDIQLLAATMQRLSVDDDDDTESNVAHSESKHEEGIPLSKYISNAAGVLAMLDHCPIRQAVCSNRREASHHLSQRMNALDKGHKTFRSHLTSPSLQVKSALLDTILSVQQMREIPENAREFFGLLRWLYGMYRDLLWRVFMSGAYICLVSGGKKDSPDALWKSQLILSPRLLSHQGMLPGFSVHFGCDADAQLKKNQWVASKDKTQEDKSMVLDSSAVFGMRAQPLDFRQAFLLSLDERSGHDQSAEHKHVPTITWAHWLADSCERLFELCERCSPLQFAAIRLLYKFAANNPAIVSPAQHPLGGGVYPVGALFNHSCDPNTTPVYVTTREMPSGSKTVEVDSIAEDRAILQVMRVNRDVRKGEELCISYVDIGLPQEERQDSVALEYQFLCSCVRCTSSTGTSPQQCLSSRASASHSDVRWEGVDNDDRSLGSSLFGVVHFCDRARSPQELAVLAECHKILASPVLIAKPSRSSSSNEIQSAGSSQRKVSENSGALAWVPFARRETLFPPTRCPRGAFILQSTAKQPKNKNEKTITAHLFDEKACKEDRALQVRVNSIMSRFNCGTELASAMQLGAFDFAAQKWRRVSAQCNLIKDRLVLKCGCAEMTKLPVGQARDMRECMQWKMLAITMMHQAAEDVSKLLGDLHKISVNLRNLVLDAFVENSLFSQALVYSKKPCELMLKVYPASHPLVTAMQYTLGDLMMQHGDRQGACQVYRQLVLGMRAHLGPPLRIQYFEDAVKRWSDAKGA